MRLRGPWPGGGAEGVLWAPTVSKRMGDDSKSKGIRERRTHFSTLSVFTPSRHGRRGKMNYELIGHAEHVEFNLLSPPFIVRSMWSNLGYTSDSYVAPPSIPSLLLDRSILYETACRDEFLKLRSAVPKLGVWLCWCQTSITITITILLGLGSK
ncbi:hypothetical protein CPB84DRAFT_1373961 [Gymnopilus junonius]|uniref:Uncharacterized protein n=1 Tax=Gymnopilus junonius TaxID=109634 RepID=A0A9P5NK29_GYMJU|nr:hypothetical protein CPB84DRAFT_1373961 [Gymnopilus junonius]